MFNTLSKIISIGITRNELNHILLQNGRQHSQRNLSKVMKHYLILAVR